MHQNYLSILQHPDRHPPHQLDIKVDAVCAVQKNLPVEKGLVHNAHIRITAFHPHFVEV